jgi:hypothetical protein
VWGGGEEEEKEAGEEERHPDTIFSLFLYLLICPKAILILLFFGKPNFIRSLPVNLFPINF